MQKRGRELKRAEEGGREMNIEEEIGIEIKGKLTRSELVLSLVTGF
jgi:hypothetical protein